jgi:Na+/H+-dicarboxylate symporter
MKKLKIHWQILIALVLGALFGIFFGEQVRWVSWMGDIFLRALKMVVVPLIFCTITFGVASIGTSENLGRIGLKTMGFYVFTTFLAIVTGLVLVNWWQPGVGSSLAGDAAAGGIELKRMTLREIFINIIPDNIFAALANNGSTLQVILFAILLGYFITKLSTRHRVFMTDIFDSGSEVMMKITLFVIAFAPLGIFGIMAQQVSRQADLFEFISRLGIYLAVVLTALVLHGCGTLPLILAAFRINPFKHYKAVSTPLLTAFSTSSSNGTLPFTMTAVEQNCGVSPKICSFTLPLGATVNMNGTALYEVVAALFIAQVYGLHISLGQQIVGVLAALLSAIGAAGIPMAGLVTMSIVLTAMGLPLAGIALVLPVDRLIDMFRTSVNVLGDTCGAVVVAKTEGEAIKV